MGQPFAAEIPIRFAHCDTAGIVFYPRYFEMFNSVVEDWFEQALGLGFHAMHLEQGLGVPTVHLETDFMAPSQLGERLRAELSVLKLGGSSFTISIRLLGPSNDLRVRSELVLALMDLQRRCAVPIPEKLRAGMERYMAAP